ncbi:hypothetical protein NQ317_008796 [Molorchus minor]|uniref:Uncharacterized protein n=1 Tax=Molorchus minor TaxID=1323400 RepID=A0ABQ9ITC1_9CUCU|nr:hypothetical protein NQ317_008796 [Molorchus minor]
MDKIKRKFAEMMKLIFFITTVAFAQAQVYCNDFTNRSAIVYLFDPTGASNVDWKRPIFTIRK